MTKQPLLITSVLALGLGVAGLASAAEPARADAAVNLAVTTGAQSAPAKEDTKDEAKDAQAEKSTPKKHKHAAPAKKSEGEPATK